MPYDYLTINDENLNYGLTSGSYFSNDLQSLYEQSILNTQNFFGDNEDDIIEFSLYNNNQEPITFNRIVPKVTYSVIQGSYRDVNNSPRTYDVKNAFTNYAINSNELLLHSQFDIKINELTPGLYYALYNPIRNVAGNSKNRLFIKEISPSRTELRLSFAFNTNSNESSRTDALKISAFANKKYTFLQILDEIVPIVTNNSISQNFVNKQQNFNYPEYAQLLGLKSTAELQEFIISSYTGFSKIIDLSTEADVVINQTSKFIGVEEQLKNFVYTYNQLEFTKEEILDAFRIITAKVSQESILKKTTLTPDNLTKTVNLFVDIIFTEWLLPKVTDLLNLYNEKYFSLYKNAINFDGGILVKILNHTSYINPVDGLSNIQIKLDQPLPSNYNLKDTCWISNISLSPIYFKVNLYTSPVSRKVYLNGVNFTVNTDTVNPTSDKFNDFNNNTLFDAKSNLKKKINDLQIDYSQFDNFINYSSAELRTKIAKNKINQYTSIESKKTGINSKISTVNSSISSSYSIEYNKLIEQQILLLNTFDEYESYLFYNTSSIDTKIQDGIEYDENNYNSLNYQLPQYIKTDNDNSDYVKFTAMVGHMFDNILVFIKKFPKTNYISYNDNNSFPKNYIEELLNSFGWNVTNVNFNRSSISQLLFNNTELTGSLSSSYFDYAKSIFNRLANNLNYIYKTKGTANSFNLIRTIFGIPSELINVVEYTSPDILINKNVYYDFDDTIYATNFDSNQFVKCDFTSSEFNLFLTSQWTSGSTSISASTQITKSVIEKFTGVSTVESTFRSDQYKKYDFTDKIPLIKKLRNNKIDWQVYIYKTKQEKSGKLICEINPFESGYTSSLSSDELPLLNGDFYTFMVRREPIQNIRFDQDSLITQSNALTHSITSSASEKYIPYEYTLSVNQYYGSQLNFKSKKSKIVSYDQNKYFSSGSYYFGNFSSSNQFYGNLDKIKIMKYSLSDEDFDEHSYNLNSISIPNKELTYENVYFLWSFDTPVNLYGSQYSVIDNQNNKYNNKFKAYNFDRNTVTRGYPYCDVVSSDIFPYQFEKFNIKQAINSNRYGPNFKSNANINKITQVVQSNLVPYNYSTTTSDVIGSDSNLIGYYISPYDYLNDKIEDFLGKEGIVNIIGDPKYITSRNYPELINLRNEFAKTNLKYVYPQEFFSTYKFYIDFSIFDFVKKISPAKSTLKTGLLLEPSIFERVKFNYKDITFDTTYTENSQNIMSYTINTRFTSSLTDTNHTSSNTTLNLKYINDLNLNPNTYNFSNVEINPQIDDRDYIYAKYGKYVQVTNDGYTVRNTVNVSETDSYLEKNSDGSIKQFNLIYNTVQSIGSGSGYITNQVTGSSYLTNIYKGVMNSGYSYRHSSKFVKVGTRVNRLAVSESRYTISNGVKITKPGTIKYYTYTKGKNTVYTTVNRNGLPNGSSPIISIPGFLSVDIENDNFPIYGSLTGSVGSPNSIFVKLPLTCSTCTSASLNNYIMNL